ncbi:MAG: hypothetical protein KL840_21880 [Aquamicrobium sp.]|nr:hypothetical protein [Aquamicrobium sp.]
MIEELRRYIGDQDNLRTELEEVDALLSVALEEVRRKLAAETARGEKS